MGEMKHLFVHRHAIAGVIASALFINSPGLRADIDWSSLPVTSHSAFQVVDGAGNGIFPVGSSGPIKMVGVLLNNPDDMLNATPGAPGFLGGQWQMFFQTVAPGDFGGTALFMGQYVGRTNGQYDPPYNYSNEQWTAELDRLNHDPATGHLFRAGDLVEVNARAPGLFHNGKTNVNEGHSVDSAADFEIHLLQANYGVPAGIPLTISDLKDSSNNYIFDQTRAVGNEHYQGDMVRLKGVSLTSSEGFGKNATMTLIDDLGRTFPMLLGLNSSFDGYHVPTGKMDVEGILDQEDATGDDGFLAGYRVWTTTALGLHIWGDANNDGRVDSLDLSILGGHFNQAGTWEDGDFNGDGLINSVDLSALGGNWLSGIASGALLATPEPTVMALFALGFAALRRRTQRSI